MAHWRPHVVRDSPSGQRPLSQRKSGMIVQHSHKLRQHHSNHHLMLLQPCSRKIRSKLDPVAHRVQLGRHILDVHAPIEKTGPYCMLSNTGFQPNNCLQGPTLQLRGNIRRGGGSAVHNRAVHADTLAEAQIQWVGGPSPALSPQRPGPPLPGHHSPSGTPWLKRVFSSYGWPVKQFLPLLRASEGFNSHTRALASHTGLVESNATQCNSRRPLHSSHPEESRKEEEKEPQQTKRRKKSEHVVRDPRDLSLKRGAALPRATTSHLRESP